MSAAAREPIALPSSRTLSAEPGTRPAIAFRKVDFPAPFAPMMAMVGTLAAALI